MTFPKSRTIAFVFYPHFADSIRLDTMPFATHVLDHIVASGWDVDVFIWHEAGYSYEETKLPESVRLKRIKMHSKWHRLYPAELASRFARYVAYACVFSVGQPGSYVGGIISVASRCPHVMLNDEFPSFWGQTVWSRLETWSARRANLIIVPSEDRQSRLREELRLDDDKPFVTLRNTPEVTQPLVKLDWHARLGIPRGRHIFIHAGNFGDQFQIPELLTSVAYWGQDVVLLMHCKTGVGLTRFRQQISHLDNPARIFWSPEPLPEDMLHSLIGYCTGSFALYRNTGPNSELVGTSSGKLMRSVACGTPVITSSFKSLDFVNKEGLGIQVNHPSEIPLALHNLEKNRQDYQKRCLSFSTSEENLREQAWRKIVEYIRGSSRPMDLSSPLGTREPC
jgi:Glycosyl transferase 4-like domain